MGERGHHKRDSHGRAEQLRRAARLRQHGRGLQPLRRPDVHAVRRQRHLVHAERRALPRLLPPHVRPLHQHQPLRRQLVL